MLQNSARGESSQPQAHATPPGAVAWVPGGSAWVPAAAQAAAAPAATSSPAAAAATPDWFAQGSTGCVTYCTGAPLRCTLGGSCRDRLRRTNAESCRCGCVTGVALTASRCGGHAAPLRALAYDAENDWLLSADAARVVTLWRPDGGVQCSLALRRVALLAAAPSAVAFQPRSRVALLAESGGSSGSLLHYLQPNAEPVGLCQADAPVLRLGVAAVHALCCLPGSHPSPCFAFDVAVAALLRALRLMSPCASSLSKLLASPLAGPPVVFPYPHKRSPNSPELSARLLQHVPEQGW